MMKYALVAAAAAVAIVASPLAAEAQCNNCKGGTQVITKQNVRTVYKTNVVRRVKNVTKVRNVTKVNNVTKTHVRRVIQRTVNVTRVIPITKIHTHTNVRLVTKVNTVTRVNHRVVVQNVRQNVSRTAMGPGRTVYSTSTSTSRSTMPGSNRTVHSCGCK